MLNPTQDRLDFGTLLAPPDDRELDLAVGTTFSLSLDALLALSLALGLNEETDSLLMKNPVCLLEALRRTADRLALFCDAARIQAPPRAKALHVLLEKTVFPVLAGEDGQGGSPPAFHPKCWILRFSGGTLPPVYRVAVLTRNLTFDRSWDLAFSLEGRPVSRPVRESGPLRDFLVYLLSRMPEEARRSEKAGKIRSLAEELPFVRFEPGDGFEKAEFLPTGIPDAQGRMRLTSRTPLGAGRFQDLLLVSPFLSAGVLRSFLDPRRREGRGRNVLITRRAALREIADSHRRAFRVLVLRDRVIDGETDLSGVDSGESLPQDIHAKLFLLALPGKNRLVLGSHNATEGAFRRNVEFSVALSSSSRRLSLNSVLKDLLGPDPGGPGAYFEELPPGPLPEKPASEATLRGLEDFFARLVRSGWRGEALEEQGAWVLVLRVPSLPEEAFRVTVKPLLAGEPLPLAEEMRFPGLGLRELSDFFLVRVAGDGEEIERVARLSVQGLPEGREQALVRGVVRDPDSFYAYLAFLLRDLPALGLLAGADGETESFGAADRIARRTREPALYELLLRTAAETPERLEDIEALVSSLAGDDVIPEDFRDLWDSFRKAVPHEGRSGRSARRD